MILRIKKNWVFLTAIKFERKNLIIDPENFVQFWALASGIFPNMSLIVSKLNILMVFTERDRNLSMLHSESTILHKKLQNLVSVMLEGENGLAIYNPLITDLSFISSSLERHNLLESEEIPYLSVLNNSDNSNYALVNTKKILPHAVLQENNYYKVIIIFENLKLNDNLKNTFLALIQIGTSLIIGSRQHGKYKTVLLEIIDKNYGTLNNRFRDLINICNKSNQFSGNLSIVDSKSLEKNFLEYSLGLCADSHLSHNFIEIITKLPELLTIN